MDSIISVIIEIGKCLSSPLKRHINYLIHYKDNIENLKDKVEKLRPIRADAQLLAEESNRSSQVPSSILEDWMTRFDKLDSELRELDGEAKENNRCFKKLCVDCHSRCRLSKEAARKIVIADELQNGGNFSIISHSPPPPSIESLPGEGFEDFAAAKSARLQIIEALKDNKTSIIGVHGMGGVGKTTLIKEVGKLMKTEKVFDVVIMVTVSQNQDIKRIQREIAEKLGMKLHEESPSAVASRLSDRLRKEKKILIILDDLWDRLESHDVGIPFGDEHNGLKIVLTTRKESVCNSMECQQSIKLRVLSERDSWKLFKRKAGDVIESRTLRDIADKVCQECEGLPLAIVTLGRALRNKERWYWENALEQFKKSKPITIEGMHAKVFASLALSYDNLESEEMKLCFLFCCLFPEDSIIDSETLMMYGIGERFLKDVDSLEEARGRVRAFFDKLKDCCLLLDEGRKTSVKMHDVIRDAAISIASEGEHEILVKAGQQIKNFKMENLSRYKRISLMNCGINSLDDDWPENLNLRTLLLRGNRHLQRISDDFFNGMKNLAVLDLSGTSISSLPPSLPCLVNLRTLYLDGCHKLGDISSVGELKRLEILSVRNAKRIRELSKEIGQLNNLMHLDLSGTALERVTPGVISMLHRVEELYMHGILADWEVDGTAGDGSNASLTELGSSSSLNIANEEWLSKDTSYSWTHVKRFRFLIRGTDSEYEDSIDFESDLFDVAADVAAEPCERIMALEGVRKPVARWVLVLLGKAECLMLKNCTTDGVECAWKLISDSLPSTAGGELKLLGVQDSIKSITTFPSNMLEMLRNVEYIVVKDGPGVQVIFHFEGMAYERPLLCNLTRLELCDLECLSSIWKGPVPDGSLHNLQELEVDGCSSLKTLFSPAMAKSLLKLEEVTLTDCENIEKLISDEEEEQEDKVADEAAESPEELGLAVDRKSSKSHLSTAAVFQNLRILSTYTNTALTSLFPLHLAQSLVNLEHLAMFGCQKLEEIISTKDGGRDATEDGNGDLFARLKILELRNLPNLMRFYVGKVNLDWASLESLSIDYCPSLKRLPIGTQSAPKLQEFEADKEWFDQLEWEDNAVRERLKLICTGH